MCRFLLVKSKNKVKPEKLLNQFARMCGKSRAPDGDWQGDGWGIAVMNRNPKLETRNWETYKSLNPIWEERHKFSEFGETNMFAVHARSAGFPQHRGNMEFNQPFVSGGLCFVFNGMIKGVNIKRKLEGKIGAQKIFSLIIDEQKDKPLAETLRQVDKIIIENSRKIIGMNIGIADGNKFFVLCEHEGNPAYFGIRYYRDDSVTLVCSEPLGDYEWKMMKKGETIAL